MYSSLAASLDNHLVVSTPLTRPTRALFSRLTQSGWNDTELAIPTNMGHHQRHAQIWQTSKSTLWLRPHPPSSSHSCTMVQSWRCCDPSQSNDHILTAKGFMMVMRAHRLQNVKVNRNEQEKPKCLHIKLTTVHYERSVTKVKWSNCRSRFLFFTPLALKSGAVTITR